MTDRITFRCPRWLKERLRVEAEKRHRSVGFLVLEALRLRYEESDGKPAVRLED